MEKFPFRVEIYIYRNFHLGIGNIRYTDTIRSLVKRKVLKRLGTVKDFPGGHGKIATRLQQVKQITWPQFLSILKETKANLDNPEEENGIIILSGSNGCQYDISFIPDNPEFFLGDFQRQWENEDFDLEFIPNI